LTLIIIDQNNCLTEIHYYKVLMQCINHMHICWNKYNVIHTFMFTLNSYQIYLVPNNVMSAYILNTPNLVWVIGAFSDALRLSPKTDLVSAGSIIPSSHSLKWKEKIKSFKLPLETVLLNNLPCLSFIRYPLFGIIRIIVSNQRVTYLASIFTYNQPMLINQNYCLIMEMGYVTLSTWRPK